MKVAKYALGNCIDELQAPSQILILPHFTIVNRIFEGSFLPHPLQLCLQACHLGLKQKIQKVFFLGSRAWLADSCRRIRISILAISATAVATLSYFALLRYTYTSLAQPPSVSTLHNGVKDIFESHFKFKIYNYIFCKNLICDLFD